MQHSSPTQLICLSIPWPLRFVTVLTSHHLVWLSFPQFMSHNTFNSCCAGSTALGLVSTNPHATQSHQEHSPEQGEVSELEENPVVQSHENDPEDVQSQLADEPTAVPEGNVFEEPQDMGVPLGHLSHDHSKNLSHPGKISNLGYFIISDQSILSQGGAQPQLFSAVVLPAPCPVYPSQSQFPAHGGGYSFRVYPCAITTPAGGNYTTHIHLLVHTPSSESVDPQAMQAIASSLIKELVTQSSQLSDSKMKPCEPETFDGSDPEKLQDFDSRDFWFRFFSELEMLNL